MTIPIQMPKLPGGADHGTVRRWFKAQGERVSQGDLLVLIDTEKAQVELESASAGRLEKILAEVGHTLRPGSDLAILTEGEAPIPQQEKPTMVKKDSKKRDETPTSLATGDVQAILMPKAGNDMEEGTLLSWKVKEGDSVKPGDVLFEIETDKATLEIESEYQGTIRRIVVQEEEMVPIHTPLAYIADSDAALDAWLAQQGSAPAEAKAEEAKPEAKAPVAAAAAPNKNILADETGRVKASPAARRMATEKGVDLASVSTGRGPAGRILSDDVKQAAPASAQTAAIAGEPVRRSATPVPAEASRTAMSGMRKAIARNLTVSKQTAPHFYMKLTIEAVALTQTYKRQKVQCRASLNDLLVLAVGRTMMRYPAFRSQVHGDELAEFPGANVGIAVAIEDGLRVPVVLDVDQKSLAELAQETRQSIQSARNGKSVNMGKGSFTISNLGMTDIEEFTAIINPPEAAILAVGRVTDQVKVVDGAIKPTKMMTMWLSSDHRVIDGVIAARFFGELKKLLEKPESLER